MMNTKLLNLATKLAGLNDGEYNQEDWSNCALGHHFKSEGRRDEYQRLLMSALFSGYGAFKEEFGITAEQCQELFGLYGCGNAKRDHKAAANYIRSFVARNTEIPMPEFGILPEGRPSEYHPTLRPNDFWNVRIAA